MEPASLYARNKARMKNEKWAKELRSRAKLVGYRARTTYASAHITHDLIVKSNFHIWGDPTKIGVLDLAREPRAVLACGNCGAMVDAEWKGGGLRGQENPVKGLKQPCPVS